MPSIWPFREPKTKVLHKHTNVMDLDIFDAMTPQMQDVISNLGRGNRAFNRAIRHVSSMMQKDIKNVAKKNEGYGIRFRKRKLLNPSQKARVKNRVKELNRKGHTDMADLVEKRHLADETKRFWNPRKRDKNKSLWKTIRYEKSIGGDAYRIGFLRGQSSDTARVIQKGLRGKFGSSMSPGMQPLTKKARKYMGWLFSTMKGRGNRRKSSSGRGKRLMRARISPENDLIYTYWQKRKRAIETTAVVRCYENMMGYKGGAGRPFTRKDRLLEAFPNQVVLEWFPAKARSSLLRVV